MNKIRPLSDLYSCFEDISRMVHETQEPVFLTKNGYGDMVVMSMEAYENLRFEGKVYLKLKGAENQAALSTRRFSSQEVLQQLMETIQA